MIRRFNFTKRRRIERAQCSVSVIERSVGCSSVEIAPTAEMIGGFAESADLVVEAYLGPRVMRFDLGSLREGDFPLRRELALFRRGEVPLFRLKVIDGEDSYCRLLGWADRIRPVVVDESGDRRASILPVVPKDLGEEIWRLDFYEPLQPQLWVNSKVDEVRNITSIVSSDADFRCLVFPAILRSILQRLLLKDEDSVEISEDDNWIRFAQRFSNRIPSDIFGEEDNDTEGRERWIEDVVAGFSEHLSVLSSYRQFKGEESSS